MKIEDFPSPNYNKKKRPKRSIKMIVIHYTGMQSERESLYRLTSIKSKVSSHYLIGQYGRVFRLVKDRNIAWHAGKSCWFNKKKLNKSSIGIELVNKGHQFGYTNFRKKRRLFQNSFFLLYFPFLILKISLKIFKSCGILKLFFVSLYGK